MTLFYVFSFILGAVVGSFLNVVINRLKTKESILTKRSHCPFCKKKLEWYELVPLISFIIQKGKCKKCNKKISWQYPLVELFTGLIFLLILFNFSAIGETSPFWGGQFLNIIQILFWLVISCFLIILFVYDLKHYLVLDKIIYPAIIIAFLYQLQFPIFNYQFSLNFQLPIFNYLLAALIGGGFFLIIVLISQGRWMGAGDIKIGVLMGLILGTSNLLAALFLAFLSGAVISIILLIIKKKTLKSEIPFGPFLVGATFIAIFWGDFLINWYFNLFT